MAFILVAVDLRAGAFWSLCSIIASAGDSLWIRILAEAACEEVRATSAMIKTSERASPPLFAGSLACRHSRSDQTVCAFPKASVSVKIFNVYFTTVTSSD
jgi:hypothetical protein